MKIHDTVDINQKNSPFPFRYVDSVYSFIYYSNKTVLSGYFHLGPRGFCNIQAKLGAMSI